ncbi:hypothetical protein ACTA71_000074 [Dictyostelium dimigraforme]
MRKPYQCFFPHLKYLRKPIGGNNNNLVSLNSSGVNNRNNNINSINNRNSNNNINNRNNNNSINNGNNSINIRNYSNNFLEGKNANCRNAAMVIIQRIRHGFIEAMKDYLVYSIRLKVVITIPKDIHSKALLKIHSPLFMILVNWLLVVNPVNHRKCFQSINSDCVISQKDNGGEDQDIQADYSSYLARVLKFTWKNIKNRDDSKSSKARSIFLICYNCDHKYESAQNNNCKGLEEKDNL